MNTYRYTPEQVIKENLYFSIPLYQRLFAWGEEQIRGLLYDLKNHFLSYPENVPYYLGMLSCIESKGGRYDLIDGQQRFTMMTLMAIVLRNYSNDNEWNPWNDFLKAGDRLHFVSRTNDNEYLRARINDSELVIEPNLKMESGIRNITSFMNSEFTSDEDRRCFAINVFKRLSFFFSKLPNSYSQTPSSLNKYFEAMNACGKGLEQHEILKVQLIRGEQDQEYLTRIWNSVCELNRPIIKKEEQDSEDTYRWKYEKAIEYCRQGQYEGAFQLCTNSYDEASLDQIGSIEAVQHKFSLHVNESGEKCIISYSEFLMLVLDLYLNLNGSYSFYRSELLNIFKTNLIEDKKDFYHQLLFYRLLFDFYIVHIEGEENANKYTMVYRNGESVEALKQYQSMLYVSQTPFYNWLKPILKKLHSDIPTDTSQLLQWIKVIDNSIHILPDVTELTYNNGIDRYWFWRLDYYLWERRENYFKNDEEKQIVEEYVFRGNRSIEHLHPQHQINNEEWENDEIHSFGNLAMISQSFNSQQSDDPVTVKFARIVDQANNHALQSIKMYKMFLDAEKSPAGWSVEVKNNHQMQMYNLLTESYMIFD